MRTRRSDGDDMSLTGIYGGGSPSSTSDEPEQKRAPAPEFAHTLLGQAWRAIGYLVLACGVAALLMSVVMLLNENAWGRWMAAGGAGGALIGLVFLSVGALIDYAANICRRLGG